MTNSLREIEDHNFFKLLETCGVHVEAIKSNESLAANAKWLRFYGLFEFLKKNVEASDKICIPSHVLNAGSQSLNQINNDLSLYLASSNLGHVKNCINNISNQVESFSSVYRTGYKKAAISVVDGSMKVAVDAMELAERRLAEGDQKLNSLNGRIKSLNDDVERILSSYESNLKEYKNSLNSRIVEIEANNSLQEADFEKRFSQSEAERSEKYQNQIDELRSKMAKSADDLKEFIGEERVYFDSEIKKFNQSFNKYYESVNKDVGKKHEEIKNLFGIVATDAITGDFKRLVVEEKGSANFFRWIAVGLMILSAFLLLAPYLMSVFGLGYFELTLDSVLARLPMSTLVLLPAGYAARESGKHRENERVMRAMHTQIAALDPYLNSLPEHQRFEIKSNLVERYFVGPLVAGKADQKQARDYNLLEQLRNLLSTIKA